MNLARLLTFEVHESLIAFYFEEMDRDQLSGYATVSMEQVRRADKELFIQIAKHTRGGLEGLKLKHFDEELPLDATVRRIMTEPRFNVLLFPLPLGAGRSTAPSNHDSDNKRKANQIEQLQAELKRLKSSNTLKPPIGKGSSGGKGKGKKKSNATAPSGLKGMPTVFKGERICFAYNLSGCSVRGADKCEKGVHVCCLCFDKHGYNDCPKKTR